MKKTTVFRLFKSVFIFITLLIAITTILVALAAYCDPREYKIIPLLGLGFPIMIAFNFALAIFWLICRQWIISSIVVLAIVCNQNNINAIYQVPLCRKDINFSENKPASTIRVVSYNVAQFMYPELNISKLNIARFLLDIDADIVCFQEYRDGIYSTDTLLGDFNFLPHKIVIDKAESRLRTAILSKYPIIRTKQITYVNSYNTGLYSDLDVNGQIVRVFSIHFQTTNVNSVRRERPSLKKSISSPNVKKHYLSHLLSGMAINSAIRTDQADVIRSIIDTTKYPVIVCCDMNETPSSFVYRKVKGDLKDGFVTNGRHYNYTFNGFYHLLRIDYILYGSNFKGLGYASPSEPWSDHKPVIMDLQLTDSH